MRLMDNTPCTRNNKHSHTLYNSHSLKGPVVVMGNSFHHVHLSTGNTTNGSVPVVPDPHVQIPGVKVLKVLIEGDKILEDRRKRNMLRKSHQGLL